MSFGETQSFGGTEEKLPCSKRALMRYELFVRKTRRGMKHFTLDIHTTTKETLADMWDFMENEYMYAEEYPDIYETIPEKRTPQPRGKNTLIDSFSRIRTFLSGAIIKARPPIDRLTSSFGRMSLWNSDLYYPSRT